MKWLAEPRIMHNIAIIGAGTVGLHLGLLLLKSGITGADGITPSNPPPTQR
jgi:hypothetical protein